MSSIWLNEHRKNITSQNGEDGIIQAIFDRIGEGKKWCCEFGAWDGIWLSNTNNLIMNQSWSSVQIEADKNKFLSLKDNMVKNEKVIPICSSVLPIGPNTLDNILGKTPIPEDFDLLSIDIDGGDHDVWESLKIYRPRVVIIEVNSYFLPENWDFSKDGGSPDRINVGYTSITLMVTLAKQKGYELAFHSGNCFFVLKEYCEKLEIDPGNWADLYDLNAHDNCNLKPFFRGRS